MTECPPMIGMLPGFTQRLNLCFTHNGLDHNLLNFSPTTNLLRMEARLWNLKEVCRKVEGCTAELKNGAV